ncbi:hypothetical protein [Pseudomonas tolaasii]|uniref:hypothetical protein n=1 Tax=Pseudomonas tolaasii TaxID=29442 RepID=UPI002735F162|nr:hypothetical protein [Pseudomonas tolaasii]WLH54618.1 hypothetical protein PSH62_13655 [Pseudomonas tolaasii]
MSGVTERIKTAHKVVWDADHATFAELPRDLSGGVGFHNSRRWVSSGRDHPERAIKSAGAGRSLALRRAYYTVQHASLDYGFDTEQIKFIWQTASRAYSLEELKSIFTVTFEMLQPRKTYRDYHHVDVTSIHSVCKQSMDIFEGQGAVAIRTLACLDAKRTLPFLPAVFIIDRDHPPFRLAPPKASWGDFTYALLEKLVRDGLATEGLRCKLFARDLGL